MTRIPVNVREVVDTAITEAEMIVSGVPNTVPGVRTIASVIVVTMDTMVRFAKATAHITARIKSVINYLDTVPMGALEGIS